MPLPRLHDDHLSAREFVSRARCGISPKTPSRESKADRDLRAKAENRISCPIFVLEYRIRDARISCTCASYARMRAMNQIAARRVNKNLQGDVYERRYMGMHAHSAVIYHFDAIQITLKLHASRFQSTNSTSTSGGCNLTKSEGTS